MPISGKDWKEGKVESKLKPEILSFFEEDSGIAFTAMEVLIHIQQFSEPWAQFATGMGSLRVVQQILDELIAENKIESKMVEIEGSSPEKYYIFQDS